MDAGHMVIGDSAYFFNNSAMDGESNGKGKFMLCNAPPSTTEGVK